MIDDRSPSIDLSDRCASLDKASTLARIEELADLPLDWNGYGASPIDPETLASATAFVQSLRTDEITTPQVVPMTRGRLQLEWHRGNRSLELEFESANLIHTLKFDQDREIEEETIVPVADRSRLMELIDWFHEE